MTVVSGSIRFIRIFVKVPRGGGVKRECGCQERQISVLSLAVFLYFRYEASFIIWRYAVRRRLSSDPAPTFGQWGAARFAHGWIRQ